MARDVFEQDLQGGDRIGWMELQLRRARDKVSQLEAIVAESNRQVRGYSERLNEMSETIQAFGAQVEFTRQVQVQIGRLKEQVTKLDEAQQAVVRKTTDAMKIREAASKNDLQERALIAKRVDELERLGQGLDNRIGRNVDFERKVNERMDGLQRDFEVSRRELLSETERNRISVEQFRRIDEQIARIDDFRSMLGEIRQGLEVRQVEQARADSRIAELNDQLDDVRKGSSGFTERASRVETSMAGYLERMAAIETIVEDGRKGVLERLLRFAETQEQQRRRQIDDLQREIRELRRYSSRLREDAPKEE